LEIETAGSGIEKLVDIILLQHPANPSRH